MPVAFDTALLDRLRTAALASPRRRAHHNLHAALDEPCQRLLVAIEPDSYVAPHRHLDPHKAEALLVLRGRLGYAGFDEHGLCTLYAVLGPGDGLDVAAGEWHAVVALDPGTAFFETKAGPYRPLTDAERAPWAPAEHDPDARAYRERLRALCLGHGCG